MTTTTTATRTASEKQVNFIAKLLGEKDLSTYDAGKASILGQVVSGEITTLPSTSASAAIKELLALPVKAAVTTEKPAAVDYGVPAGRYAVDLGEGVKFYVIDQPTEGRWAGYTFVKVQASDDLYPVKQYAAKNAILRAIAVNPAEASLRYGRLLGSCGVCGRTLTDETSRERGIGPVCADKTGW
jgi:hypothetical protein